MCGGGGGGLEERVPQGFRRPADDVVEIKLRGAFDAAQLERPSALAQQKDDEDAQQRKRNGEVMAPSLCQDRDDPELKEEKNRGDIKRCGSFLMAVGNFSLSQVQQKNSDESP